MTQDELYAALKENDDARTAMMAEQIEIQRQHAALIQNMMEIFKSFMPTVEHETEEAFEKRKADHTAAYTRDLRDRFAAQALAGILAGGFADTIPHDDVNGGGDAAFFAYQYANAMIKERSK